MKDKALRDLLFTAGIVGTTDGKLRKVVASDGIRLENNYRKDLMTDGNDSTLNAKYQSALEKIKSLEFRADMMEEMFSALCELLKVDLNYVPSTDSHYTAIFYGKKRK